MELFEKIGPLFTSIISSILLWCGPKFALIVDNPLFTDVKELIGVVLAIITIVWMIWQMLRTKKTKKS